MEAKRTKGSLWNSKLVCPPALTMTTQKDATWKERRTACKWTSEVNMLINTAVDQIFKLSVSGTPTILVVLLRFSRCHCTVINVMS